MIYRCIFGWHSARSVCLALCAFAGLPWSAVQPALADWREELGVFRIALITGDNEAAGRAALEPFRLAVQEKLRLQTELRTDRELGRLIINQSDRPAEYIILPASAYAAVWLRCECIEPLVIARSSDGEEAIRSVLIVRSATNIKTLAQLGGKTVFGLSEHSLTGYAIPRKAAGEVAGNIDWQFSDSAEDALNRFIAGEGDAIAGWIPASRNPATASRGTLARLKALAADGQSFSVLWQSEPVPNRVHAVRKNLDGEAKRLLRELLTGLNDNDPITYDQLEPDFSGGFFPARQSQFSYLIDFLNEQEEKTTSADTGAGEESMTGEGSAEPQSGDAIQDKLGEKADES